MSTISKGILAFIVALILAVAGLALIYIDNTIDVAHKGSSDNSNFGLISQNKEVFEPVLPDNPVVIPQDFKFHNEFQHGWWQFFANVKDQDGKEYGIQWSYYRIASNDSELSGWLSPQLFISYIVVSDEENVWREQRMARGGIGQAGMTLKPFRLWIDNWRWRSLGMTPFPGLLDVDTDGFKVRLKAITKGPFVLPRERGYVAKHDLLPIASHNLTAPFLAVEGQLMLSPDEILTIEGTGWMNKEWGSGLLTEGQQGWDWFVVHIDDETTLSIHRYRPQGQMPYLFGTLATNHGHIQTLNHDEMTVSPLEEVVLEDGQRIPLSWRVDIPKLGFSLEVNAVNQQLWLPFALPYWEGPIQTSGSHEVRGFMQLTGY